MNILQELSKIFDKASKAFFNESEQNFLEKTKSLLDKIEFDEKKLKNLEDSFLTYKFPKHNFELNRFGKPSFTLFSNEKLAMDIYYWPESNISIHSHNFIGCFKVLGSNTSQITFDFKETKNMGNISLGELKVKDKFQYKGNDTCIIYRHDKFIHSIKHNENTGKTLIIRTINEPSNLARYYYPNIKHTVDSNNELTIQKILELYQHKQRTDIDEYFKTLNEDDIYIIYLSYMTKIPIEYHEIFFKRLNELEDYNLIENCQKNHSRFIKKLHYIHNI